ncbi:MAG: O-antigen polymerase [Gemmatimonadales bacterium]
MAAGLLLLAVTAWTAHRLDGSWAAPGSIFALSWFLYALLATAFVIDPAPHGLAALWIAAGSVAVVVGGWSLPRVPSVGRPRPSLTLAQFPLLRFVTLLLVLAGVVEILYLFTRAGFSPTRIISFVVIAQLSAQNRAQFGYGDMEQGIAERVLLLCLYSGPLFGGLLFRVGGHRRDRVLGLVALINVVFVATLYGSRMGVLFGGSFWLSSYLAATVWGGRIGTVAGRRLLFRLGILGAIVLFGLSLLAMIVRYAETSSAGRPIMLLVSDPFGFIAAFGIWLQEEGLRTQQFLGGYRTFVRFFQFFGVPAEWPPEIDVGFNRSNIYTVFRGLIEDFGTVGAMVWLGGFGAIARLAFRGVIAGRRWAMPILVGVYAFILIGFSFSMFAYTIPSVAYALFVVYAFVAARLEDYRTRLTVRHAS